MITCDMCHKAFDPRNGPVLAIGGHWICCADRYTPEEIAEALDLESSRVYEALGLEEEEK